jgi:hypothetical protein
MEWEHKALEEIVILLAKESKKNSKAYKILSAVLGDYKTMKYDIEAVTDYELQEWERKEYVELLLNKIEKRYK